MFKRLYRACSLWVISAMYFQSKGVLSASSSTLDIKPVLWTLQLVNGIIQPICSIPREDLQQPGNPHRQNNTTHCNFSFLLIYLFFYFFFFFTYYTVKRLYFYTVWFAMHNLLNTAHGCTCKQTVLFLVAHWTGVDPQWSFNAIDNYDIGDKCR